jgi:hypothetical protein
MGFNSGLKGLNYFGFRQAWQIFLGVSAQISDNFSRNTCDLPMGNLRSK